MVLVFMTGGYLTQTCCGHLNSVLKICIGSTDFPSLIQINFTVKYVHSQNFVNIMYHTTIKQSKKYYNNKFFSEENVTYNI